MEINEVVKNFANQFDETDASEFTPATDFRQLDEWSSLIALSVIAMIDEEYDVAIKSDDIKASKTVQDLFDIVNSRK
jgi:acyl carrier protein